MTQTSNILRVSNLRVSFSSQEVVHGVSFDIAAREVVALVGESGCGKSVTALSLARLLPSAPACQIEGSIRFCQQDVLKMSNDELRQYRQAGIAYVFQDPAMALHPSLQIGIQLTEAIKGSRRHKIAKAVACLEMAGLREPGDLMHAYPFTLSGGMQQRVVIAMALIREPKLLIADEPTTALDVTIQAQILSLLKDLQNRLGMSMLFITHNLGLVASTADRVCVMYAGKIVEAGAVEHVLCRPKHPYAEGLLHVVPQLHGDLKRLEGIPGTVPEHDQAMVGCAFKTRCKYVKEICSTQAPNLEAKDGDKEAEHQAACHYPLHREGS